MLYTKFDCNSSKLTTGARKKLKPKEFALPKSCKFPASSNTKATKEKMDAKANKVLKGEKK